MRRIYICAPYAGDVEANKAKARIYAWHVLLEGMNPFVPHLYYDNFMVESEEREKIMELCLDELVRCDEVWQCSETVSDGMRNELRHAYQWGIPIIEMWRVFK